MKFFAHTLALLATLAFSGMMFGCEEPGPAEQAGQEIDEAVEDAGDAIDDAFDE